MANHFMVCCFARSHEREGGSEGGREGEGKEEGKGKRERQAYFTFLQTQPNNIHSLTPQGSKHSRAGNTTHTNRQSASHTHTHTHMFTHKLVNIHHIMTASQAFPVGGGSVVTCAGYHNIK